MLSFILVPILKVFPLFPVLIFFGIIGGIITGLIGVHKFYTKKEKLDKNRNLMIIGASIAIPCLLIIIDLNYWANSSKLSFIPKD